MADTKVPAMALWSDAVAVWSIKWEAEGGDGSSFAGSGRVLVDFVLKSRPKTASVNKTKFVDCYCSALCGSTANPQLCHSELSVASLKEAASPLGVPKATLTTEIMCTHTVTINFKVCIA